jgi:Transcriptional regulators
MKPERVTIKDLARQLNVSVSTVYRALHDAPDVSAKTKQLVVSLAKELNYEPNAIAQGLVNRQSKLIGVLVPTIQSHYFSQALSGMTDVANEAGFHIIFYQSNECFQQEKEGVRRLVACNVDGLLISLSSETKNDDSLANMNIPVVMFDRILHQYDCTKVIVDEYEGAYKAVELLIKKGCKRIAHIAGPQNLTVCANRLKGYKNALEAHGMRADKKMIAVTKSFEHNALKAIRKIMEQPQKPDGIFMVNDLCAAVALKYFSKKGIRVPHDVQVVGFNDDPVCNITQPTITSVMQPAYEVGKLAMGLLIDEILTGLSQHKTYKLRTSLVVRESTK